MKNKQWNIKMNKIPAITRGMTRGSFHKKSKMTALGSRSGPRSCPWKGPKAKPLESAFFFFFYLLRLWSFFFAFYLADIGQYGFYWETLMKDVNLLSFEMDTSFVRMLLNIQSTERDGGAVGQDGARDLHLGLCQGGEDRWGRAEVEGKRFVFFSKFQQRSLRAQGHHAGPFQETKPHTFPSMGSFFFETAWRDRVAGLLCEAFAAGELRSTAGKPQCWVGWAKIERLSV